MMGQVKVYGADWCEDTQATQNHLDSLGVQFQYINVEQDRSAEQWVKQQNNGKRKTPTVDVAGLVLSVPDACELEKAVRCKWMMG